MAAATELRSPLQDIDRTLARVNATKIAVAVSGGKDSLAVLDACVRRFGKANVVGFCMTLVTGLECEWRPIRLVEKRYGVKVLEVPHWELSRLLKNHVLRPYTPAHDRLRVLKQADVEAHVRKLTGIEWCAWGMRAADSIIRNAMLKRIQGVDEKARRVYPIWTLKKRDVLGYLKARKIPIPRSAGETAFGGGVELTVPCLRWIREHEPNDFRKILQVFPLAEGLLFRAEVQERKARTEGLPGPGSAGKAG